MSRMAVGCFMVLFACGCAHQQLRFNTSHYARTAADINTQQVLDNLAKFAANPNSLPHFTFSKAGQCQVTDTLSGGGNASFSPKTLTGWSINPFSGVRANLESLTVETVTDPRKLELMRCAYQRVVCGHCLCQIAGECPNCEARFNEFYLGSAIPSRRPRTTATGNALFAIVSSNNSAAPIEVYKDKDQFNDDVYFYAIDGQEVPKSVIKDAREKKLLKALYEQDSIASLTKRTGKITYECLGSCWFKVGHKRDIPRRSECALIGRFCDTYIWVPDCSRAELTKLTIVILDIAMNNAAVIPTVSSPAREVVTLYDKNGEIASEKEDGVIKVTQQIPADKELAIPAGLEKTKKEAKRILDELIENKNDPANEYLKSVDSLDPVLRLKSLMQGAPSSLSDEQRNRIQTILDGFVPLLEKTHSSPSIPNVDPVNLPSANPAFDLLNSNLQLRSLTPQQ